MSGGGFTSLSRAMFLGFVRDRAALIFSIMLPVLFLLFFGTIYKSTNVPKLDLVTVGRVSLLRDAQAASPKALAKVMTIKQGKSWTAALAGVRKGTYDAAVRQAGDTLVVRYSIADQTKAGLVNSELSSIVQSANQAATGKPATYTLTAGRVDSSTLKPIQYFTPGLLGWALASGATFGAAITLVSWRQNKLLRRLRLAPVSTASIVAARVGIAVAIGLIQLAVFLVIARLPYFGLRLTAAWWMSIPLVVCGILAFLSIGLLVGAISKTQQAATAIANLIILPMAFLGGAFLPLDFAPSWVQQVSYVMPLRYLVNGMLDVMARGEGPASALPAIGILLAFSAIITVISVRLFRWDDV